MKSSIQFHKWIHFFPLIVLVIATGSLNLPYLNSLWVPTQGWYLEWARYINNGKIPYLDFSFPFPPLYLELNRTFLVFPDPLIASRIFDFSIEIFMTLGLYFIGTLYVRKWLAVFIAFSLVSIWQLDPTNTIAGYFEFATMLLAWGLYFYIKNAGKFSGIAAGVLLVSASLVKQNFVAVVFILFVAKLYKLTREKRENNQFNLNVVLSIVFSYLVFALYLILNGNLLAFFDSMLTGGGKSITGNTLFSNLIASADFDQLIFPFVVFGTACFVMILAKSSPNKWIVEKVFFPLALAFSALLIFGTISIWGPKSLVTVGIGVFIGFNALLFLLKTKPNYFLFSLASITATVSVSVISWFVSNEETGLGKRIFDGLMNHFSDFESGHLLLGKILWAIVLTSLLTRLILWIVNTKVYKSNFFTPKLILITEEPTLRTPTQDTTLVKDSDVVFALIASLVLNSFNGQANMDSNIVLTIIVLGWSLSKLNKVLTSALLSLVSIFLIFSIPVIPLHVYSWFGWDEFKTVNISNEIPLFKNFKLTTEETYFYSNLNVAISTAENKLNNPEKSTIISIPAQPVLGYLSNLDSFWLHCPIMHIDICPEKDSEKDLVSIVSGEPTVVIYYALPESLRNSFDTDFRKGKISASNKIYNFLKSGREYRLVESVSVPNYPNTNVEIYVKKNEMNYADQPK